MKKKLILIGIILSLSNLAFAQNEDAVDDTELGQIEEELSKSAPRKKEVQINEKVLDKELTNFSDLVNLSSFSDISVIQKRFLPKTERFELFGGLSLTTNNPFFNSYGFFGRFGYYFTEQWGLELNYLSLNTTERQATKDLKEDYAVRTANLVTPQSFLGLDVKYSPIYGKIAWFNGRIIPFDLYFSLGGGVTQTNTDSSPGTLHLGTGQLFSLTKNFALRWDFSWNFYSAEGLESGESQNFNNLFLTVGASFLFPEATYR